MPWEATALDERRPPGRDKGGRAGVRRGAAGAAEDGAHPRGPQIEGGEGRGSRQTAPTATASGMTADWRRLQRRRRSFVRLRLVRLGRSRHPHHHRRLNERGARARSGAPWNMVTIRDILRNRAYIGTYARFGIRVPGNHPPLVDQEIFRRAQERMLARRPRRGVRGAEAPFLLSGLAHCSACDSLMIGVIRRRAWKRKDGSQQRVAYRYYQCQSRANRSTCFLQHAQGCRSRGGRADRGGQSGGCGRGVQRHGRTEALDGKSMREAGRRFHEQVCCGTLKERWAAGA